MALGIAWASGGDTVLAQALSEADDDAAAREHVAWALAQRA